MDKTLDLRVQKTYDALIQSFLSLLQEKNFDKITVNAICEQAQVRRPTFYKHFKDKYDFIQFVFISVQEDTLSEVALETKTDDPLEYFMLCFDKVMEMLERYQEILTHAAPDLLGQSSFELIDTYLTKEVKKRVTDFLPQNPDLPTNTDFLTNALLGTFRQVAMWWFQHRDTQTKAETRANMRRLLQQLFIN